MSAQIIQFRDYQTLDERLGRWCRMVDRQIDAGELAKEFNRMAEEGTEVVCVMDTAPSEYVAPPTDCA